VGVAIALRPEADQPDEAELKELVRARLRSSRVPEIIHFVDELPYNEMGKLLRREVRKLFAE
jgi:acyl-coenzyme A synthetase/AMP-(fatty) acid ligase